MTDNMIKRAVANELNVNIGCCARCVLRFLGVKNCSAYSNPVQTLSELPSNGHAIDSYEDEKEGQEAGVCMQGDDCLTSNDCSTDNQKRIENSFHNDESSVASACSSLGQRIINNVTKSEFSCAACLGTLEEGFEEGIVQKVCNAIELSGHECDSFTLSVSMPLSLLVREHSMWLYLQEKHSSFYGNYKFSTFVPSVKDVLKWVCGPALEKAVAVPFKPLSPFQVALTFDYNESVKELDFMTEVAPTVFQVRKKRKGDKQESVFTIPKIQKALQGLSAMDEFRKFSHCPPKQSLNKCHCIGVSCFHGQVFLAGHYNKYSRKLPQSPWIVDDKRHAESSVQEKVCEPVVQKLKGDDYRFSSAGREDIDVRMLGKGRPFIIEVINPKIIHHSRASLRDLQNSINSSCSDVRISDLQVVTREDCAILKEAELSKTKSYSALIWTAKEITQQELEKLEETKDLKLNQLTPLRVLHRRPLAVRERFVHSMKATWLDEHHFRLFLKTQAGTYIKEFVHSDFGRTQPNLGTLLGAETDILELDVESVDVNWPPRVDEEC